MQMLHDALYYLYILFFGAYVSMRIACGSLTGQHWQAKGLMCPVLLALQGLCLHFWGMDAVRMLYPLIAHMPIVLMLTIRMRVKWSAALVSVALSYSLCQLPRWVGLVVTLGGYSWGSILVHLALSQMVLMLLDKWCLDMVHEAVMGFGRMLGCFGAIPALYYGFEYFMVYTGGRFAGVEALEELLNTALVLFFVLFMVIYQRQARAQRQAEYQAELLEMELEQSGEQLALLRTMEERTAVARHDLQHHLRMISSLLQAGRTEQAQEYTSRIQDEAEKLTLVRCCEHETLNLLLSMFSTRVREAGAELHMEAQVPSDLALPDTELCALISNALENALHAVSKLGAGQERVIRFFASLREGKLLVEVRNPYDGEIVMLDGLPQASSGERRCGCRSIRSIVEKHRGMYSFEANQGLFVMRAAIPVKENQRPCDNENAG